MNKEQTVITYRYILQRFGIDRYEDAALKDLMSYYNKAKKQTQKDLKKAIAKRRHGPTIVRLQRLEKETDAILEALTNKVTGKAIKPIVDSALYSYKNTNAILSWDGMVDDFNYVSMSRNQISNMVANKKLGGYMFKDWLWSALSNENDKLKSEVNAARIRGVGYKKLISQLGDGFDDVLASGEVKRNLETVVKTYIQSMNAKAHRDIYEANADTLKKVEWSAIMENGNTKTGKGTCPRCMALDGNTYKTVAAGPDCPLHPRCRCMYLPITKTWEKLGFDIPEMEKTYEKWYDRDQVTRRINRLGKKGSISIRGKTYETEALLLRGATDKNFADWWATKPDWWKKNAVGKTRFELIKNTKLDFKDIAIKDKYQLKKVRKDTGDSSYQLGDLIRIEDLPLVFKRKGLKRYMEERGSS